MGRTIRLSTYLDPFTKSPMAQWAQLHFYFSLFEQLSIGSTEIKYYKYSPDVYLHNWKKSATNTGRVSPHSSMLMSEIKEKKMKSDELLQIAKILDWDSLVLIFVLSLDPKRSSDMCN